ncbi:hypothetical protein ILFOPFJJ_01515 [Ensifer psoraleae]|uniref:helix-turn-helix transcriptional regulator n=1 Tax=Sinorhizobium psoraleae TaxID=520838 RepID=UPI001569E51E|nr:hypothetical protein [Sinorhizobium psoraleae]NRP70634.1 hypothetical protein [Sinorhizobium psoraleae]
MNDSPRLIGRKEAAEYCGISPTCFSMWVASHKMPPPIPGTRKWDKRAIDAKLDEISGLDVREKQAETGLQRWRRERDKKREAREAFAPQVSLREAPRRVLMFMAAHPESDTIDQIRGAGQRTIDKLVRVGVVECVGTDGAAQQRYAVTRLGQEESARLEQWLAPHVT